VRPKASRASRAQTVCGNGSFSRGIAAHTW